MKALITELTKKELEIIAGGSTKVMFEYVVIGGKLYRRIIYK